MDEGRRSQMVKHWWILLRGKNLLMIGAIPLVYHFGILKLNGFDTALNTLQTILLALSIMCAAGAGNIVNDLYDLEADKINKPHRVTLGKVISERFAMRTFGVLAFLGIAIPVGIALTTPDQNLILIFSVTSLATAIVWLYAVDFKGRVLIGNLLIAVLAALNAWYITLFDVLPTLSRTNEHQLQAVHILNAIAVFAFLSTLIRELIKDVEDIKGDRLVGYKTLATQWSIRPVKGFIALLVACELALLTYAAHKIYHTSSELGGIWVIVVLALPLLLYMIIRLGRAKEPSDFTPISSFMKVHMLLGIITPIAIGLIHQYLNP